MPLRERDLAPAIVAHFEALGYEVFHEIELGGRRADLVAENASELVGTELKLHEWRNALRQTMAYQLAADRAFVALPLRRAQDAHRARHLFDREGVGPLAVSQVGNEPRLGRRHPVREVDELVESGRELGPHPERPI